MDFSDVTENLEIELLHWIILGQKEKSEEDMIMEEWSER